MTRRTPNTLLAILVASVLTGLLRSEQVTAQAFHLRTLETGLESAVHSNGLAAADYDGDGDLDLYVVSVNNHDEADPDTWNRLYSNNGDGTFTDVTEDAGVGAEHITGYPGKAMGTKFGASWGDYDNDGDPDLFLTNVGPEILYRNNGDGTFTEVTENAGLIDTSDGANSVETSSAVWWDPDVDGDLDLYVSTWKGPNHAYRNNGDGTFDDVTAESGLANETDTWTAIPLDADEDGTLDLYLVNDFAENRLLLNRGSWHFEDVTESYGLGDPGNGMGVDVADVDGNGHLDIYLTNIAEVRHNPLYLNLGAGNFDLGPSNDPDMALSRAADFGIEWADWAWGTEFFDCDHDGDLDMYVVNGFLLEDPTPNHFFLGRLVDDGAPYYQDVTENTGTAEMSEARALLVFDPDDDGDLDMISGNWFNPVSMYENVSETGNYVKIDLEGTASNPHGFGAVVEVTANGVTWIRQHDGVGFLGQSILPEHVGVGSASIVDEIRVRWPSGRIDSWTDIAINTTFEATEGRGIAVAVDDPSIPTTEALTVYPNPFSDELTVDTALHSGVTALEVFTLTGKRVSSETFQGGRSRLYRMDLADLAPGTYLIRLTGTSNRIVAHRIVVKAR